MTALLAILSGGVLTLAAAWVLGAAVLGRLTVPREVQLAVGAAALSTAVFLLLLAGAGTWPAWLLAPAAAAALIRRRPAASPQDLAPDALAGWERIAAAVLFGGFGLFYAVHALAPEIVADGFTYHLGLAAEYARTGAFPNRITFYDMVPQGLEMLYTLAFSIGRHSAAKLVEFGCFATSFPLLFRVARRLGIPDRATLAAAAFYFVAPVVAVTGASSYNDAGQVFFALSAFYLLLLWQDSGNARYLFFAGLLAGFCYAVKMPGLIVPALGGLYLLLRRQWKGALLFTLGAVLTIAPWMVRALVLTGNPLAPLFNSWFPNPWFHVATDRGLAGNLRGLHGVPWWRVPWELAVGGGFSGIYGPWLLWTPLALLAARRRAVQLCCGLALLVALPWLSNTSARFVMPAIPLAGLALGLGLVQLPRAAAWIAIALQAAVCLPLALDAWEPFYGFRLHGFPLAAALRLQPENDYLASRLDEYKVARMLEANTPPDARILALLSVATAYTTRDVRVPWQSAEADWLLDTLRVAGFYGNEPFFDVAAEWPLQPLRALRVRLPRGHPGEWCMHEFALFAGPDRVPNSPRWTLDASPNPAEAVLAFDHNLATRWRTWEPMREDMYFEVELDTPQRLSGAVFQSHTPVYGVPFEFQGQSPDGRWMVLSASPRLSLRTAEDLRLAATHAVGRAGYRYLLVPSGAEGHGPLGNVIAGHEVEWGLDLAAEAGRFRLYRIRQDRLGAMAR